MPIRSAVRAMRLAISPRFATNSVRMPGALQVRRSMVVPASGAAEVFWALATLV
jgi:hypothetical protein